MSEETWKALPGYEGLYEVSDAGFVRSLDRWISSPLPNGAERRQFLRGRVLIPTLSKGGYQQVTLCDGRTKSRHYVHSLVLLVHVGPRPDGMPITRHFNGNKQDNRRENLAYGTYSENTLDSVRHGTHNHADKSHCVNGHEFTPGNTYTNPRRPGHRICRACMRKYRADYEMRQRAKALAC